MAETKAHVTTVLSILQKEFPAYLETIIERAGKIGTALHKALELINDNKKFKVENDDAIFQNWLMEYQIIRGGFHKVESEISLENNGYCGRIDSIADEVIIDYKSGTRNKNVEKMWLYQLAAYYNLCVENKIKIKGGLILHFNKKNGKVTQIEIPLKVLKYKGIIFNQLYIVYNDLQSDLRI